MLIGLAACQPPLADDPKAAFFLNFEGPPPLPADFRGGAVPGAGHDVWFCFHAPSELKLRDADRWQSADPNEEIEAFSELCPDAALRNVDTLQALRARERGTRSEYSRVLLRDPATNAYFVRTLRLKD